MTFDDNKKAANKRAVEKYRATNPVMAKACCAKWRIANPDYQSRYYIDNINTISIRLAKHAKDNPGQYAARWQLRNARKLNATPSWANIERIKCYYQVAAMLTREGLRKYQVDHIVPLQGKNVCGLHVENNLQIMTASENARKGNRHGHI